MRRKHLYYVFYGFVLSLLHKENKTLFPYKPKAISGGFNPEYYIGRLYKLLNVNYRIYDYNVADNIFAYSFLNEEFNNDVVYKVVKKNINTYFYRNATFKYIEEDIILRQQNVKEYIFVLFFEYNRYIKINLAMIEKNTAV